MAEENERDDMITLVAEDRHFSCHKGKLVASSDYFRAMFSSNFTENAKNVIELQGIDADCLQLLIQYVESGCYSIPNDNSGILALLQTSAMLQFGSIQAACEHQILTSLSISSCLEVYFFTSALGLSNVAASALTIAVWKFKDISLTQQFLQLTITDVVEYLSQPALYTGTEGEWLVWEAVVAWIQENEDERLEHLVKLLMCLDFHALTQQDLANILFYPIISDNLDAQQIIQCVKMLKKYPAFNNSYTRYIDEEDGNTSSSVSAREIPEEVRRAVEKALRRPGRHTPQIPCVVGFRRSVGIRLKDKDSDNEDDTRNLVWPSRWIRNAELTPVLYSFDLKNKNLVEEVTLNKLCEGPLLCSGYQVCAVGPSIYILGGEYQLGQGNWNKSLWRYSTASKKWIVENPLPQPRRHHMACVLGSTIYVLGGFGRHRIIQSTMDAFDTESGNWKKCPAMPHSISHGAVCAFQGRLMVFTQEMQLLTFYPTQQKWSAIPLPSTNKAGYRDALPWKNHIYLIDKCSTQVYKFSPEEGQNITCVGKFVAPPINVCIVDGIIYNFSQDDLNDCHVIETLDINTVKEYSENKEKNKDIKEENKDTKETSVRLGKSGKELTKIAVATEIWRGEDPDLYMFTTKCPAEDTFSLGSFPLLRVNV